MEAQLQELIGHIKSEGVAVAQQQAEDIISEAKVKAATLIAEAEAEALSLRQEAEQEIARKQSGSEAALVQAGRDLLLATRMQVEQFFTALLEKKAAQHFSGEPLAQLILSSVKGYLEAGGVGELHIDEKRYQSIEAALRKGLQDSVVDELSVFPDGPSRPAFSLSMNNGAVYVDVSAKELAQLLKPYVNKYLGTVLDQVVAGKVEEETGKSSSSQKVVSPVVE